ncbi:hypothetical protein R6Q57_000653 [Mikania cordata]
MIKLQKFFMFFITILPSVLSQKPTGCDQSCPGGRFNTVPYPFGFTSGCKIQLNCTPNGEVLIGEFAVQQFNPDGLLVSLPAKCGRSIHTLTHLYGEHYAPMSTNAILMENCTAQMKNCMIPMTMLRTHLEIVNCSGAQGGDGNVSCYSSDVTRMFLDYENVTRMGCRFLFSGVATEIIGGSPAVSLDIQMVRLGWWLKGSCDYCSVDADCTAIVSPFDGSDGHRCKCKSGFDGDGFKASSGCRSLKGSSGCNPSKYLSGHCGGTGRIGVLVGAVVVGASLIVCIGLIICFIRRRTISRSRTCKALDFSRRHNEVNLASLAVDRIKRGCLDEIIDPSLEHNKDTWAFSSIHKVAELAFRCLAFHSEMRPTMAEVAAELEQIMASREETTALSLDGCRRSSASIANETQMSEEANNSESDKNVLLDSMNSTDERNLSSSFVDDQWLSESNSPSSNSRLGSL